MVPGLPDVHLEAVTVVYGDTDLRARLASVALNAMGIDAPIHRGCEQTLSGKSIMWAGHEGDGVDGIDVATYAVGDAVDVLIDLAAADPGTLDVLAIAPLTNIASVIRRDPNFARNVHRLYVMGGEFQIGWPEHNLASDVDAARVVLGSPVRKISQDNKGVTVVADKGTWMAERVIIGCDNGEAAHARALEHGLHPESWLVRRSSLEDVFLRLTGRTLDE